MGQNCFHAIAPKDTKMFLAIIIFLKNNESFADLCFLGLYNETFSQDHFHNKFRTIFNLENLKTRSIFFFKTLT